MQSHQGTFRAKALARIGTHHDWCHASPSVGMAMPTKLAVMMTDRLSLRHEDGAWSEWALPLTQRKYGDYLASRSHPGPHLENDS